jgi:glycosyltransferase involved in cell wall biosynthesis
MKNKRILVVIDSLGYGGAERLVVSLLPYIEKYNYKFDVMVLFSDLSLKPEIELSSINVITLNQDYADRWSVLRLFYYFRAAVVDKKYDIIWGHLFFGNLYSGLYGIFFKSTKVIWTLHSPCYGVLNQKKFYHKPRQLFEKFFGNLFVDYKVAVSVAVADDYRRLMRWRDIDVIYNGIDFSHFPVSLGELKKAKIRKEYNVDTGEFMIVTPGRYSPEKGHMTMIDAIKILEEKYKIRVTWIVIGNGVFKSNVHNAIISSKLKSKVLLLDAISHANLLDLINSSDIAVIPSIREPFGIVAVEVMGLGIPIIVSRVDGLIEVTKEFKCALTTLPGDPDDLASAIFNIHSRLGYYKDVCADNMNSVRNYFDISICASNWAQKFSDVGQ